MSPLKPYSQINTGFATMINNDHGISPDGTQIVISSEDVPSEQADSRNWLTSKIYLLPIQGGTPQLVTEKAPSFWHGWSPDGQTLIYTARRNDDFDIYAIDVNGGEEIRLTDAPGLDDGSEFRPMASTYITTPCNRGKWKYGEWMRMEVIKYN
jgi:TolB protein